MRLEDIEDVDRLKKINRALMARVESAMDQQGNAFSLFETALQLEGQVRRRTDELSNALHTVERANADLAKAKELAEQTNVAKTRFLAAASHDILQPLNAALLSLSVLTDMQQTDAGRNLATQIERSLETMNDLLKTLLDISKLDAGVIKPKSEAISLNDVYERLASDFIPIARENKLRLKFRSADHQVTSDRTMLRRILQNLISNALKYTLEGGVLVSARRCKGQIAIDIIDTGPGIPVSHQETIFDEFHRGPLPTGHDRDSGSGLGLGLSIVRRTINTLGHQLEMRSIEGKGTRFRILLPLSVKPDQHIRHKRAAIRSNTSRLAGAKVLLVENDPAGTFAAMTLFESWECNTRTARSSADVLTLLKKSSWVPDIIVADLHLDHGDLGTRAVEYTRNHLEKDIPALIVTADPSLDLEKNLKKQGMEMMNKPLRPANLRALMSHIIENNSRLK